MRKGLIIFSLLLPFFGLGQNLLERQYIRVEINRDVSSFEVHQSFESHDSIDEAKLYWDLYSWKDENSLFAQQLINEQNVDFHFADSTDLGSHSPIQIRRDTIRDVGDPTQIIGYIPSINYSFTPPSREFNGEGKDPVVFAMNRPFVRYYDSTSADFVHQLHGYNADLPAQIGLNISNDFNNQIVVPDLPGIQTKKYLWSNQTTSSPFFMAFSNAFELETIGEDSSSIHWIYTENFPPINLDVTPTRLKNYVEDIYGKIWPEHLNVVVLNDVGALRSRSGLLIVEYSSNPAIFESRVIEAFIQSIYANQLFINGIKDPWLIDGMAHYHRYDFMSIAFPNEKLLGKFSDNYAARFLDVDDIQPTYFHEWLYLFMARQGLDQPMSDSIQEFAPLNVEAVIKGKTALAISTLRGYAGERAYKRGMRRFMETQLGTPTSKEDFLASVQYFANRDLSWFYGDLYTTTKTVDYQLTDLDQCPNIVVARVRNRGELNIPFPTIGYDEEGEPVLLEWHEGHLGKKDVQLHQEIYSKVEIDPTQSLPELNGRNNMRRPSGLFQGVEPLRLQFYTGLDQPNKTQIYWMPSVKFNAYDGVLAGVNLYNITILPKRWEYKIGPEYSTRTGQLTGSFTLKYNLPLTSGIFHSINAGLYGRYFHYDEGLAYGRLSPGVNFLFRKSSPRSTVQNSIRIRAVGVQRELRPEDEALPIEVTNADYVVTDFRFQREEQNILHPSLLEFDVQYAARFSKVSVAYRQRYMLPNRQWLGIRGFVGAFIHNQQPENQPFFAFGLSGTQDYLFDYSFIGRSDSSGVWSQQFFVSDGGFKSGTNAYSSTWMSSLSLNVPFWKGIGAFGDIGYVGSNETFYWDYGFRLAIVPDFLEVYFPIQSSLNTQITSPNYISQIRFILNFNQGDIVQRLRRGWY